MNKDTAINEAISILKEEVARLEYQANVYQNYSTAVYDDVVADKDKKLAAIEVLKGMRDEQK